MIIRHITVVLLCIILFGCERFKEYTRIWISYPCEERSSYTIPSTSTLYVRDDDDDLITTIAPTGIKELNLEEGQYKATYQFHYCFREESYDHNDGYWYEYYDCRYKDWRIKNFEIIGKTCYDWNGIPQDTLVIYGYNEYH